MRRIILLSIFISLLLFTVAAYSVLISLSANDVAQLGGTGEVVVNCPASGSPCKIDKVEWVLTTTNYQHKVDKVKVTWTPALSSATYDVYVTLYGSGRTGISSGSASQSGSNSQVTTIVDIEEDVFPKDVYYVEIVIVQTDWT